MAEEILQSDIIGYPHLYVVRIRLPNDILLVFVQICLLGQNWQQIYLYAVSELFEKIPDRSHAEDTALSVIDDIRQKDLSKQQVIALVRSKLEGTKHRERSSQQTLTIGSYEGVVKVFAKRGQIELSMKNLPPEQLPELQRALIAKLEDFFKEQQVKSVSSSVSE